MIRPVSRQDVMRQCGRAEKEQLTSFICRQPHRIGTGPVSGLNADDSGGLRQKILKAGLGGIVAAGLSTSAVAASGASTNVQLAWAAPSGDAALAGKQKSDADVLNAPAEPSPRPDFAFAWGGEIVQISTPRGRPSLLDMLPKSTATLAEMVSRETGRTVFSTVELILNRGDTLAKILKQAQFTNQDVAYVSEQLSRHINLRKLQIGTKFTAALNQEKQPVALQLHMPKPARLRTDTLTGVYFDHYVLRGEQDDADWIALKAVRPIDTRLVHAGSQIESSLYHSARDSQIPTAALDEFVTVMGFTVDFQREIQTGDSYELVFEKTVDGLTGAELSSGTLHYAGIVLSGRPMGFFRFVHRNGRVGWYDAKGRSAVRTLMRTPVNGARLSSKFGMRRHPVTGYNAMHRGIDFAVPKGTPILAAGSGEVEVAGWNGSYGKYIRIRHNSTYKTAYAHLSGYASGVRSGRYVEQGQIIGYVGSTGRSTGPHLHYEILVNNRKVNPLTVKLPTGKSVPAEEMAAFRAQVKRIEKQMQQSTTPQYAGISFGAS